MADQCPVCKVEIGDAMRNDKGALISLRKLKKSVGPVSSAPSVTLTPQLLHRHHHALEIPKQERRPAEVDPVDPSPHSAGCAQNSISSALMESL
ncbi:hypothetical protein NQZ68_002152 [Dissostichus eleginoides]|nr:hypothetical protein NQZ68_002152 [Dissostichus eleginoides]